MEELFPFFITTTFIIFGLVMTAWTFSRSREILEKWASDNGYQLIKSEFRWLRRGPFFWSSSKGQTIYYVTVQSPDGQIKCGWVRCGGFFWGILQQKAQVKWDR